ncbi:MAG: homoserine kinase [Candidatus Gastranaerophilales bacterium]|nr:homoserine kinase [Candidatus Gastranaerophilales bacterium]
MKVSVKVPATIANLGPGFDSFGLALPLYNVVSVEETVLPGTGIQINIINEKNNDESDLADVPTDKTNIVYKAIELLYNFIGQIPNELKITIKTQIPVSRGLGSSASVIVGGLIAANELLGRPADEKVLMSIATEIEGHPDNITPAFKGGMTVASWEEDGSIIYRKLPWNDEWKLMVCVPDYELNTEISRSVLPKEVPMKDAVFNLKKSAMFIDALYNKDEELLKSALFDKLHQPYREKLVPGLVEIMNNLKHVNGVIGTVLCGAGPSILIIYNGIGVSEIKETVTNSWNYFNVKTNFFNLPIEKEGAQLIG